MGELLGTVISAQITTGHTANEFSIGDTNLMQGGHHSVTYIEERDGITDPRRREGMTCWVAGTVATLYRLVGGTLNTDWQVDTSGTAAGTVYHNLLPDLQGGTNAEFYHSTKDQFDAQTGYGGAPTAANPFVTQAGLIGLQEEITQVGTRLDTIEYQQGTQGSVIDTLIYQNGTTLIVVDTLVYQSGTAQSALDSLTYQSGTSLDALYYRTGTLHSAVEVLFFDAGTADARLTDLEAQVGTLHTDVDALVYQSGTTQTTLGYLAYQTGTLHQDVDALLYQIGTVSSGAGTAALDQERIERQGADALEAVIRGTIDAGLRADLDSLINSFGGTWSGTFSLFMGQTRNGPADTGVTVINGVVVDQVEAYTVWDGFLRNDPGTLTNSSLIYGSSWSGAGTIFTSQGTGVQAEDYQEYTVGTVVAGTLTGGTGWSDAVTLYTR